MSDPDILDTLRLERGRSADYRSRAEKAEAQVRELEEQMYSEYKFGFFEGFKRKVLMTPKDYRKNWEEMKQEKNT